MKLGRLLAACSVVAGAVVYPAVAQTVDEPGEAEAGLSGAEVNEEVETSRKLATVVVTSTKRSGGEELQSAPIAASAYNAELLADKAVVDLLDLDGSAPNVQMETVGTVVGTANFTIRGLGILGSVPSEDPAVGVFIDGVFLGTTYGVITDTFDLESVEILRGPQGVLFGRNVTGGAVLLRSRRPTGEFGARAKFGFEDGSVWTAGASVEGALGSDVLSGKLSVYYSDDDGWYENDVVGRDVGQMETLLVRPTLVLRPSDDFESTLIWEHGEMEGDGGITQCITANEPPSGLTDNFNSCQNEPGVTDIEWDQITSESSLDTGIGTFTNIVGYRTVNSFGVIDVDSSPADLFVGDIYLEQEQFSEELRLNTDISDRWELISGLYYFTSEFTYDEKREIAGGAIQLRGGGDQTHDVFGAFVTNFYDISDTLTLQAGLRYTSETKDVNISSLGSCDFVTGDCNIDFSDKFTTSDFVPKVGVQWQPSDDLNFYAHWTKGFRSGGYNFRDNPGGAPAGPYDAEEQDSYEVGMKADLFQDLFRLNVASYYNTIDGIQRTVLTTDPVLGSQQIVANAGDGKIVGVEIETLFKPHEYVTLGANVGLQDFEYTSVSYDLTSDGMIDGQDKALLLPRFADTSYSVNATVDYPLASGATISPRIDYAYRSETPLAEDNSRWGSSVRMLNASLRYTAPSGNWNVQLYGKNLLDDVVQQTNLGLPFGPTAPRFVMVEKGRRWGINLNVVY